MWGIISSFSVVSSRVISSNFSLSALVVLVLVLVGGGVVGPVFCLLLRRAAAALPLPSLDEEEAGCCPCISNVILFNLWISRATRSICWEYGSGLGWAERERVGGRVLGLGLEDGPAMAPALGFSDGEVVVVEGRFLSGRDCPDMIAETG